jgi:putative ABC transport system permease protein
MHLVEGRNFAKERSDDARSIIINQQMLQELAITDPLDKKISRGGGEPYTIIGVMEDFNYETFRSEVRPLALFAGISPGIISVKVSTDDFSAVLKDLEAKWDAFNPNLEFRYTFLDQSFARMYDDVKRIGIIFTSFAILAIVIACLGLFALSAFIVEQRSKEMSIRKVLGASLGNIFQLLTRHFIGMIVIALVIGTPVVYYLMQKWLEDYAYRINLSWVYFALAGLVAVTIALATISYHALRTAHLNPIKNLRDD